ncbi:hypothetical protein CVT24_013157 [Panaeolus cyanescens]|uniref:F-box domain-containing protein n=1 Tax=Panaeolus cyanescens TaxID=181874 RepID=A0A409WA45_9AGAR|nr:hypothetical protein CVT24_013157 [Panaeolus cyanescens]
MVDSASTTLATQLESTTSSSMDTGDEQIVVFPFHSLDIDDLSTITSGSPVSSLHTQPKQYYGPVTIRNFISGHIKRDLRTQPASRLQGDVFLHFPIELQLMILEHLHPIDLYHLSIVSKDFRKLVMNPKAIGVWRLAFERHPNLPRRPPCVPESQWAFMLFGPGICGVCGKHGALTDFAFQKRFCEKCMKHNYAHANKYRDTSGNAIRSDHVIWNLIPRSHRYNGLRYTSSYPTFSNAKFLVNDFKPMMRKVTIMQILIDQKVPGVEEIFEDWKRTLSAIVSKTNDAAEKANMWAMDVYRSACMLTDERTRHNTATCKKRLKNLGHAEQDINYVQYTISQTLRTHFIMKMNPRAFRKLRPIFEHNVANRKVARLKMERREHLQSIYTNYVKTLAPTEWQSLPPKETIQDIEGFHEFLDAEYNERGHVTTEYAVSLFPSFIEGWRKRVRDAITSLESSSDKESTTLRCRDLDLATSILKCEGCRLIHRCGKAIFGWEDVFLHKSTLFAGYSRYCDDLEWSNVGEAAVVALLRCLGLDEKTTTIKELDQRDDRFICGNCMPRNSGNVNGLRVYSWRECVLHSEEMHQISSPIHRDPIWHLLTPEATRFVLEHELPFPSPDEAVWGCNHCAQHYHGSVTQGTVWEHLLRVHLIRNPVIGIDLIYDKRRPGRRRKPFLLGLNPAYELRCQHCPEMPIYKLWELEALKIHLRLKHNKPDPLEGADWTRIRLIAPMPSTSSHTPSSNESSTSASSSH